MTDADIRALQIKMLTEDQLRNLHRREEDEGSPLHSQILNISLRLQPIKEYYRLTGSPVRKGRVTDRILYEWSSRVRAVLDRFTRETGIHYSGDVGRLHLYDWAIWRSDLDFYFKTVSPTKTASRWSRGPEGHE